jgi:hypothetical protein
VEKTRISVRREGDKVIAAAANLDPSRLPTLGVWAQANVYDNIRRETVILPNALILVSSSFPNVPGFTCDSWCYESAMDFLGARGLEGGRLELRHRLRDAPQVILVTTVTPEPGAVEFAARPELESGVTGELPANLQTPNLCWQLIRAQGFASAPDPYPEFVKRCFIFTENGRTFLGETTRRKIPSRPDDEECNNPPWVQMYLQAGQPEPPPRSPSSWADYSPDRYTVPVIGAVSRDRKYLAAIANGSATGMAQAWHDCMHNNPAWLPADAPTQSRTWRVKVYVMENDPDALLARVARDFGP